MSRNFDRNKPRCYLVYALAPDSLPMGEADRVFNDFINHPQYGVVICHDHFVDQVGAYAVFFLENENQFRLLSDATQLKGWQVAVHPLTFSDSGAGFLAQIEFTLKNYRQMTPTDLIRMSKSAWAHRWLKELLAEIGKE